MSYFDYITPGEAIRDARSDAPEYKRITGRRAVCAERIPNMITRTAAGYSRKPEGGQGQMAHGHLHLFKEIERVAWASETGEAEYGMAEVFFTDGTTDLVSAKDFLCVEHIIITDKK